jgi:hypothetical protein
VTQPVPAHPSSTHRTDNSTAPEETPEDENGAASNSPSPAPGTTTHHPALLVKSLLALPTFSRRAQLLRDEKEHEHILLPEFAEALEQLQSQRKKEQDTMINTVKRYQLKQLAKIFRRWAEASRASKKAVAMLSMFLRDSHDISTRQVFKEWFHVAQTVKYHREIAFEKTAKQEMEKIQEELARIREKTMVSVNCCPSARCET